jgi:hypothetical protein
MNIMKKILSLVGIIMITLLSFSVNAQNVGVSDLAGFTPTAFFHIYKSTAPSVNLFQIQNVATTNVMTVNLNGFVGINIAPSASYRTYVVDNTVPAIRGEYSANIYGYVGSTNSGIYGTSNTSAGAGGFFTGIGTDGVYALVNETGASGFSAITADNLTGVAITGYGASSLGGSYIDGAGVRGFGTVGVVGSNTSGIYGYLGSSVDGVVGITTNASGSGVFGQNSSANGDGLYGINSAASGAGTGSGIQGYTSQGGNGTVQTAGVWGVLTNTAPSSGCGIGGYVGASGTVSGYNKTAVSGVSLSVPGGCGAILSTDNATGYGTYTLNSAAAGTGLISFGNNVTSFFNPNTAGAGGIFSGSRYGIVSYANNESTAGTGFRYGMTYASIYAIMQDNVAANTSLYHFAIHGTSNDYGAGYGLRTGGVLGNEEFNGYWGALGYQTSTAANRYGVYAGSRYTAGVIGGKVLEDSVITGFGIGGYGGLMGGWIRGTVYGFVAKGERYSLYVDGKTYTNNTIAQLSESNNTSLIKGDRKRIVSYVPTSTSVDVYTKGTAKLVNGTIITKFGTDFSELISSEIPVTITVTPMGECNGLYIAEVANDYFVVKELQKGTSNVEFSWIAVGTKYGCEKPENPVEVLEYTYDSNMNGVMFNESDTSNSATPVYWDNIDKKLKFEEILYKSQIEQLSRIENNPSLINSKSLINKSLIELKSEKIIKLK